MKKLEEHRPRFFQSFWQVWAHNRSTDRAHERPVHELSRRYNLFASDDLPEANCFPHRPELPTPSACIQTPRWHEGIYLWHKPEGGIPHFG